MASTGYCAGRMRRAWWVSTVGVVAVLKSRFLWDVPFGLLFGVFVFAVSAQMDPSASERSYDAVAFGCIGAAAVSVGARRVAPVAMLVVVTLASSLYIAREYPGGPIFVAVFVVLYTLSVQRSRWLSALAGAASISTIVIAGMVVGDTGASLVHVAVVGWAIAAVVLGQVTAQRDEERTALARHAHELERTREAVAARRVAEDRVRIAREVHDSVSHSLASIALQSGVALHLGSDDDAGVDALRAIRYTSTQALTDLKHTLGLLRDGQLDDAGTAPSLSRLVETAQDRGLKVTIDGDPDTSVGEQQRSAQLAVISEAFDNASRHAPGSRVLVSTKRCSDSIEVIVVNSRPAAHVDGSPPSASGTGFGLVGLDERVRKVGGELRFGPLGDGGFGVVARFPAAGAET